MSEKGYFMFQVKPVDKEVERLPLCPLSRNQTCKGAPAPFQLSAGFDQECMVFDMVKAPDRKNDERSLGGNLQ
jgi:hypothetical protein